MNRVKDRNYEPAELVPAGETLLEWLERAGMTRTEFARRASLTPKHINQVVKGGVGISAEVALAFERVTEIPARYWAQLDANYQTAKLVRQEDRDLREHTDLLQRLPLKELQARGFISRSATRVDQLREVLRFFAVADPEALERVWLRPAMYRRSPAFEADEGALACWLRLAEREAAGISTAPFDATAAREAVDEMRSLSALPGIDWLDPLKALCSSLGIALVILKELPKCRINGATRWLSPDKALIALSLRHRRNDIFWFTLFHELCHVLRHSKKETFVDTRGSGIAEDLELEADRFASRVLIPVQHASRLRHLATAADVEKLATELGIASGIVVGRMQHDGLIPHNQWTHLIVRYRFTSD